MNRTKLLSKGFKLAVGLPVALIACVAFCGLLRAASYEIR